MYLAVAGQFASYAQVSKCLDFDAAVVTTALKYFDDGREGLYSGGGAGSGAGAKLTRCLAIRVLANLCSLNRDIVGKSLFFIS